MYETMRCVRTTVLPRLGISAALFCGRPTSMQHIPSYPASVSTLHTRAIRQLATKLGFSRSGIGNHSENPRNLARLHHLRRSIQSRTQYVGVNTTYDTPSAIIPAHLPWESYEEITDYNMKFENFPILIPAFTARIQIDRPLTIAPDLLNIPFLPNSGSLESQPEYPHALCATFVNGADYLRLDPDGQHVRLEVTSTARDAPSGALVRFSYNGVVDISGEEGLVISGDMNATTTGFGNAFVQVRFETECPALKPIEDKMYVGSGRFIVEEGQPTIVEYMISEVAAPSDSKDDDDG